MLPLTQLQLPQQQLHQLQQQHHPLHQQRCHTLLPFPRLHRPLQHPLHVPQALSSRHCRPRAPRAPPASTRPSLARRRALPVLRANTAPALLFPQPAAIVLRARSPLRARRCAVNAPPDMRSRWWVRAVACRARTVSSLWAPPPPATRCLPPSFAGAAAGGDAACSFSPHRLVLVCRTRSSRVIFLWLSINAWHVYGHRVWCRATGGGAAASHEAANEDVA